MQRKSQKKGLPGIVCLWRPGAPAGLGEGIVIPYQSGLFRSEVGRPLV